ncbi:MAG: hypothetical protein ACRBN8_25205 [Nannocystales bacterium]
MRSSRAVHVQMTGVEPSGEFDPSRYDSSVNGTQEAVAVELSFGQPEHGWMPVDLRIGEFTFRTKASNVLNDPLADFLELRVFVLGEMLGHHLVSLWLEPAAYIVEVTRVDQTLASVKVWFEEDFVAPKLRNTSKCVFAGVVERSRTARRIEQVTFQGRIRPTVTPRTAFIRWEL